MHTVCCARRFTRRGAALFGAAGVAAGAAGASSYGGVQVCATPNQNHTTTDCACLLWRRRRNRKEKFREFSYAMHLVESLVRLPVL